MTPKVKALAVLNVVGWIVAVPLMVVALLNPFVDFKDWPGQALEDVTGGAVQLGGGGDGDEPTAAPNEPRPPVVAEGGDARPPVVVAALEAFDAATLPAVLPPAPAPPAPAADQNPTRTLSDTGRTRGGDGRPAADRGPAPGPSTGPGPAPARPNPVRPAGNPTPSRRPIGNAGAPTQGNGNPRGTGRGAGGGTGHGRGNSPGAPGRGTSRSPASAPATAPATRPPAHSNGKANGHRKGPKGPGAADDQPVPPAARPTDTHGGGQGGDDGDGGPGNGKH